MRRRNWFKKSVAMLVMVATVLNTGFSTIAADLATTEDSIVVENTIDENDASTEDSSIEIDVVSDDAVEDVEVISEDDSSISDEIETFSIEDEEAIEAESIDEEIIIDESDEIIDEEEEVFEEAEELKEGELTITDNQIEGSGYDSIKVYINTDNLNNKDRFKVKFSGPESASYNPIINSDLDKTDNGYLDFDNLEGEMFTISAISSDDVILSYSYNEDGYPMITVESKPADKIINIKNFTSKDGDEVSAIVAEGYDSFTVEFITDDLNDKAEYTLYVESDADAKVDGMSANEGISGLNSATGEVTIENLDEEQFTAYVVTDNEIKLETVAEVVSDEDGKASITITTIAEKRVYEFEDSKVYVKATLEDPKAIPDDAYFAVTPIRDTAKYLDAMNDNSEDGMEYTDDNTLVYDIGFYTDDLMEEEIEPEEGSVKISIEFKKNQLEDEIGATEDEAIEVTHVIEKNDKIVDMETLDAAVSTDSGEVEFVADSFSPFIIANKKGETVTVNLNAPDGTYYVALGRKVEVNEWWSYNAYAENAYENTITEVDVANGRGSVKIEIAKEAKTSGGQILDTVSVLLLEPKQDQNFDSKKIDSFNVVEEGGVYNYQYLVNQTNNAEKEVTITLNAPSSSTNRANIIEGLNGATDFMIVADEFDQGDDFEGNIAVNHFGYKTSFQKGPSAKDTTLTVKIEKQIVSDDKNDYNNSFSFGIYDGNNKVGETLTINNFDANGYGSVEYTIPGDAKKVYQVYELDSEGNRVENGHFNGDFNVTYVYPSVIGGISSRDSLNYARKIYNGNIVDLDSSAKTAKSNYSNLSITMADCAMVTTSENVSGAGISIVSEDDFDGMISVDGMLNNINTLSGNLADCGSNDDVEVYYVPAEKFEETSLKLPDSNGKTILLNVVAKKGDSSIDLKLQDGAFYIGDIQVKDTGYYKTSKEISHRLFWNFIYDDRTPYDGTINYWVGNSNYPGFMIAPNAKYVTHGVVGSISIYASKVIQAGTEIHKNSLPDEDNRKVTVSVINTKPNTGDGSAEFEFNIEKLFEDADGKATAWSDSDDVFGFKIEKYDPEIEENPKKNFIISDAYPMPDKADVVYLSKNNTTDTFGKVKFYPVASKDATGVYFSNPENPEEVWHNPKVDASGKLIPNSEGTVTYRVVMYKITELTKDDDSKVTYDPEKVELSNPRVKIVKLFIDTKYDEQGLPYVVINSRIYQRPVINGVQEGSCEEVDVTDGPGCEALIGNIKFTNKLKEEKGSLTVVKSFVGTAAPTADADKNKITFTITGPNSYSKTVTYKDFTNGSYTLDNLPLGEYTVEENNGYDVAGYDCATTYSVDAGKTTISRSNKSATVTVTNTYTQKKGSLEIEKVFAGSTSGLSDTYKNGISFTIVGPSFNRTVSYSDFTGNKYLLSNLTLGEYTVTETNNNIPGGYTCTTTYQVGSNETKSLNVSWDSVAKIVVTNTYTYTATGSLTLKAKKTMSGRGMNDGETFTFSMTGDKTGTAVLRTKLGDGNSGYAEFDTISYTLADTATDKNPHVYYIEETHGTATDLNYSPNKYKVSVVVSDNNNGTLGKAITYYKYNENSTAADKYDVINSTPYTEASDDVMSFTNSYIANGNVKFSVTKSFAGIAPAGRTFDFTLTGPKVVDNDSNDGVDNTEVQSLVYSASNTTVDFAEISFDQSDIGQEYEYVVTEKVPATTNGVIYGGADRVVSYTYLVKVENAGSGNLKVSYKLSSATSYTEGNEVSVTFTNDYDVQPAFATIKGQKALNGNKTLEANKYTFILSGDETAEGWGFVSGSSITTDNITTTNSTNNGAGFEFGKIKFTAAGIYTFTVTEDGAGEVDSDGVYHSNASHTVVITVSDDNNGQLYIGSQSATDVEISQNSSNEDILFTNEYSEGGLVLRAKKVLDNHPLEASTFEFSLLDADKNVVTVDGALQTKSIGANGEVAFDEITYTKSDLASSPITYYVRETVVANSLYNYDGRGDREITVTLTEADNVITATADYSACNTDNAGTVVKTVENEDAAIINNTYLAAGSVPIGGYKYLSGRSISDDDRFVANLIPITAGTNGIDSGRTQDQQLNVPITKISNPSQGILGIFGNRNHETSMGSFDFEELEFTHEDMYKTVNGQSVYTNPAIFKYKITETGSGEDVTNDPNPIYVTVTVTETSEYTTNDSGEKIATLSVVATYSDTESSAGTTTKKIFVNTYSKPASPVLNVKKVVTAGTEATAPEMAVDKEFTFELYNAEDMNKALTTTTNKIDGVVGSMATFTDFVQYDINDIGHSYDYVIKETETSHYDCDYASTTKVHNVTINVVNSGTDADPVVGFTYVYDGEDGNQFATIKNSYIASGSLQLAGKKTVNGQVPGDKIFKFNLTSETDDYEELNVVNTADGAITFSTISYTAADLTSAKSTPVTDDERNVVAYKKVYTISEVNDNQSGFGYDGAYTVEVYLTDEGNGTIETRWFAYSDGTAPVKKTVWQTITGFFTGKVDLGSIVSAVRAGQNYTQDIDFDNSYSANGSIVLQATKSIKNNAIALEDGDYSFTLVETYSDWEPIMEDGAEVYKQANVTVASGVAAFESIPYTLTTVNAIQTHYYLITEDIPNVADRIPGVVYDTAQYKVTVNVVDNGSGMLVVTSNIACDNVTNDVTRTAIADASSITTGEDSTQVNTGVCEPAAMEFVNEYKPKDIEVKFGGTKTLVGGSTGTFKFVLSSDEGNPKPITPEEVTVEYSTADDADNSFEFSTLTYSFDDLANYDEDGVLTSYDNSRTYNYTVTESALGEDMICLTEDYSIAVTITNSDGVLTKVITVNGVEVTPTESLDGEDDEAVMLYAVSGIDFTNQAVAPGALPLYVKKVVEGTTYADKDFEFTLVDKSGATIKVEDEDGNVSEEDSLTAIAKNGETGIFDTIHYDFSDLELTDDGTYEKVVTYSITEVAEDADDSEVGYKYSLAEYEVVATATCASQGAGIDVSYVVTKVKDEEGNTDGTSAGENSCDNVVFTNGYTAIGFTSIVGLKEVENYDDCDKSEFGFDVYEVTDVNGTQTRTKLNDTPIYADEDGLFTIGGENTGIFEYTDADLEGVAVVDGNRTKVFNYIIKEHLDSAWAVRDEAGNIIKYCNDGITYDEYEYQVEITVVDDNSGDLNPTAVILNPKDEDDNSGFLAKLLNRGNDDTDDGILVFTNVYDAEGKWDPEGIKNFNSTNISNGMFFFELREVSEFGARSPMYKAKVPNVGTTFKFSSDTVFDELVKSNPKQFLKYSLEDCGTHYYEMSEVVPEGATDVVIDGITYKQKDGVIYDNTVAKITVVVTDLHTGVLDVKVTGADPAMNYAAGKFNFTNIYSAKGQVGLVGTKKMTGRELSKTADGIDFGKYGFTITEENVPANTATIYNDVLDATGKPSILRFNVDDNNDGKVDANDASYVSFLNYSTEDPNYTTKHTYRITENESPVVGVTKDTSYFIMEVTLRDNGDGTLAVGKKISHYNSKNMLLETNLEDVEFNNSFGAKGNLSLSGMKELYDPTGKRITDSSYLNGAYEFKITKYSDAARRNAVEVYSVRSGANGAFTFDFPEFTQVDLWNGTTFDEEGIFYYRIEEKKPLEGEWIKNNTVFMSNGVEYDNTLYDFNVKVAFNGTDKLDVDIVDATSGEKITLNPTFKNTLNEYEVISGKKIWNDNVTNPASRPDVTVRLYSSAVGRTPINEYTIHAPETTYRFTTDRNGNKLPTYDERGRRITYTVDEAELNGYLSEVDGYNIYNTAGNIRIRKIDSVTGNTVAGATLAIIASDGTEVERWTSEVSAHVVRAALTSGATYTLREIAAPTGYEVASDVTFTVPTDGSDITVTMEDTPITGAVRLIKRDADTREALAGAEFALYTDDGVRVYATGTAGAYSYTSSTSNGVFVTNSAGELTITDLPYGSYYFVETKAPDGYELSSDRATFSVVTNGATAEVTFLDKKATGSVRLRKVNATGTRTLAGAVFELYVRTPQTLGQAATSTLFRDAYYLYGTYRTNEFGEIFVDGLPWDDYYFVEVEAPTGYEVNRDVNGDLIVYTFTVNSTSTVTIGLGDISNDTIEESDEGGDRFGSTTTSVAGRTRPRGGVLGARVEKGGVLSGVLGVRAKPTSGVLGERVGPVTGDVSNMVLWGLLLLACVGTIIALLITGKKKEKAK